MFPCNVLLVHRESPSTYGHPTPELGFPVFPRRNGGGEQVVVPPHTPHVLMLPCWRAKL